MYYFKLRIHTVLQELECLGCVNRLPSGNPHALFATDRRSVKNIVLGHEKKDSESQT